MKILSIVATVPALVATFAIACGAPISTDDAERESAALTGATPPSSGSSSSSGGGLSTPSSPPTYVLLDPNYLMCVGNDSAEARLCSGTNCQTIAFSCFPYHCSTTSLTCATSCASASDCANGFACVSGSCVQNTTSCKDAQTETNASGATWGCAPYSCNPVANACMQRCSTTNDCALGYVCNVTTGECVSPNTL